MLKVNYHGIIPDITGQGQAHAGANRSAVDRRDNGYRHPADGEKPVVEHAHGHVVIGHRVLMYGKKKKIAN